MKYIKTVILPADQISFAFLYGDCVINLLAYGFVKVMPMFEYPD